MPSTDREPLAVAPGGTSSGTTAPSVADEVELVAEGIEASRKLLVALGDESRQRLMVTMMRMGDCSGARAAEIAERTHLSRPATSHHLQILKDAGVLKARKEGTRIYYYFDPDMGSMNTLIRTLDLAVRITQALPDRSGSATEGGKR